MQLHRKSQKNSADTSVLHVQTSQGVVDPQVFVIGGGVSKAGKILFDYIEKYYKKYAFPSCKDAKFALATLGNDAGIYGAAKLML